MALSRDSDLKHSKSDPSDFIKTLQKNNNEELFGIFEKEINRELVTEKEGLLTKELDADEKAIIGFLKDKLHSSDSTTFKETVKSLLDPKNYVERNGQRWVPAEIALPSGFAIPKYWDEKDRGMFNKADRLQEKLNSLLIKMDAHDNEFKNLIGSANIKKLESFMSGLMSLQGSDDQKVEAFRQIIISDEFDDAYTGLADQVDQMHISRLQKSNLKEKINDWLYCECARIFYRQLSIEKSVTPFNVLSSLYVLLGIPFNGAKRAWSDIQSQVHSSAASHIEQIALKVTLRLALHLHVPEDGQEAKKWLGQNKIPIASKGGRVVQLGDEESFLKEYSNELNNFLKGSSTVPPLGLEEFYPAVGRQSRRDKEVTKAEEKLQNAVYKRISASIEADTTEKYERQGEDEEKKGVRVREAHEGIGKAEKEEKEAQEALLAAKEVRREAEAQAQSVVEAARAEAAKIEAAKTEVAKTEVAELRPTIAAPTPETKIDVAPDATITAAAPIEVTTEATIAAPTTKATEKKVEQKEEPKAEQKEALKEEQKEAPKEEQKKEPKPKPTAAEPLPPAQGVWSEAFDAVFKKKNSSQSVWNYYLNFPQWKSDDSNVVKAIRVFGGLCAFLTMPFTFVINTFIRLPFEMIPKAAEVWLNRKTNRDLWSNIIDGLALVSSFFRYVFSFNPVKAYQECSDEGSRSVKFFKFFSLSDRSARRAGGLLGVFLSLSGMAAVAIFGPFALASAIGTVSSSAAVATTNTFMFLDKTLAISSVAIPTGIETVGTSIAAVTVTLATGATVSSSTKKIFKEIPGAKKGAEQGLSSHQKPYYDSATRSITVDMHDVNRGDAGEPHSSRSINRDPVKEDGSRVEERKDLVTVRLDGESLPPPEPSFSPPDNGGGEGQVTFFLSEDKEDDDGERERPSSPSHDH